MKASDLFIESLKKNKVKTIYGVPWEENLDLIESIRKDWSIELILTRNEQTAVFMAATYGRLTGHPWVSIATLWPWATNMMTWVAYAQLGWFPVIVITWQKPIKKSKQGLFQIIDVVWMMKPVTKFSTSVVHWFRIPYIVDNAFRIASSERPWACLIELPEDIAWEHVDRDIEHIIHDPMKIRRPIIDQKSLYLLKNELEKSRSPIILIWAWANRKRITKYLWEFINTYNIPFFTSQMWKWVIDESSDQYLWTAALTSGDYIHEAIWKSDLILSVWYDSIEKPTHAIWSGWTRTIHINFYESNLDQVYEPYLEIIWDIWSTFWQLSEIDISSANWNFDEIYAIRDEYHKKIQANINNEDMWNNIMWPRQLVQDLRDITGKEDIIALDNWLYKVWFARNYPCYSPNTLLLDNALATMWAWVASGLEAKRMHPDKDVVVVTWDGGLVMNLWDLETVVRLWLDLTIVVINNRSYGMIQWKQVWWNMLQWWLDFWNPDFVKLAESFWGRWYMVIDKNDFKATLQKANKHTWLKIIDLKFEYPQEIN